MLTHWSWLHFVETNPFLATSLSVVAILGVSFLVYQLLFWVLRKRMQNAYIALPMLIRKHTRGAALFTLFAFGLVIILPLLPVPKEWLGYINRGITIFQIFCICWLFISIIRAMRAFVVARYADSVAGNNYRIRGVYTQYKIFERILIIFITILGIIAVLMTFEGVRQIGVSLLASAGVVGVIVGFAAQKSLGGVLAGLQIALSQPMRIDDTVVVEGEWGTVEEITLTYVVIRIWDDRRLVVPISFFLEKSFYNMTRNSTELKGTILLQPDPSAHVDSIRTFYLETIKTQPKWDGREASVVVVDVVDGLMNLRFLCSGENSSALFDLRCTMREALLKFIAANQPDSFPRQRFDPLYLLNKDNEGNRPPNQID